MEWGGAGGEDRSPGSWEPSQASLLRFPQHKGNPGSLCGRRLFAPDPDLMMPLIWFLNSGFAAFWAGAEVLLAILVNASGWIEFQPL